jgi:hypothetical protein
LERVSCAKEESEGEEMTPTEKRLAMASVEGWKQTINHIGEAVYELNDRMKYTRNLPDYTHDLNAVSKVEAKLTGDQWLEYVLRLSGESDEGIWRAEHAITIARSTAAQRCEALLKTLNLWSE